MNHQLTITNESTGKSVCSCGLWEYHVINFRPAWPKDKADVRSQVDLAFDAHVRIQRQLQEEAAKGRAA